MIGTVLNGYKIAAKLKEGVSGDVYQGVDSGGNAVAIKVLNEAASARPDKRKEFAHGAQLARSLKHPNILQVIEAHDGDPFPYAVMEYFESENLKVALWHHRDWLLGQEFFILRQLAAALRHCHDAKIIHGDIRPENILINGRAVVKLTDFSLAQTLGSKLFSIFGSKKAAGSPLYMSPEAIQKKTLDHRADIYSFGVVAYELLTKHPPFLGTSAESIFEKHLKQEPPPMGQFLERPDLALEKLLKGLLAKRPKDRPDDWTKIMFELTSWERKATQIRMIPIARRAPPEEPAK
ncbi:MAG TPA: serine/threonine-protein kinase [Planctomycetota bacterium]|nr:serine/threonine-protein kinase [Planctomycetota bacterium]